MRNAPIITSLTDLDLYFITMGAAWFHNYPNGTASFRFLDRKKQLPVTEEFVRKINEQLDYLCELQFTKEELHFIFDLRYLKNMRGYKEFLRNFRLRRELIECKIDKCVDGEPCIDIRIKEDCVITTQFFEIFTLAIVNELYGREMHPEIDENSLRKSIKERIPVIKSIEIPFMEFGTRRRFSKLYQDILLENLVENSAVNLMGTSNVFLAMKYGVKPMGTMAHSWVMFHQALDDVPVGMSQKKAFEVWQNTFKGDNGYALTDTLGTDKFLKDFTYLDALTFRGLRHDSGDPQKWADKMLNMYRDYGINPELRTLIFSDSVNAETANSFSKLKESVNVVAGIGSYLTNPISPTHCVIKMETANGGKPVAKLSDEPSKAQCTDKNYLEYLKRICDGGY